MRDSRYWRRAAMALALLGALAGLAEDLATFTLTERLGVDWTGELVSFELPKALEGKAVRIVDEAGRPMGPVDLPAWGTQTFRVVPGRPFPTSVDHQAAKSSQDWPPGTPLARFGTMYSWVGFAHQPFVCEGQWLSQWPVERLSLTETGDDQVTTHIYRYDLGGRKYYQASIRYVWHDRVVLVDEEFRLSEEELARTSFVQPPNLAPPLGEMSPLSEWLIDRGMGWKDVVTDTTKYPCFALNLTKGLTNPTVTSYALAGPTVHTRDKLKAGETDWSLGLVLTPFQARGNRVTAVTFADDQVVVGLFSRHLGAWEHANENRVPLVWTDEGIVGHFFAFEGKRSWGIWIGTPAELGADVAKQHGLSTFARIRTLQAKYGQTPLDTVKGWTLAWELPPDTSYPRLFTTPESLARMRQALPGLSAEQVALLKQDAAAYALLANDAAGLRQAFDRGYGELKVCVDAFLKGGHDTADTYTHRYQEVIRAATGNLDIGLACPTLTAEERARALAAVAFLAYKTGSTDYWRYDAYGGGPSNPNMMSIATNALVRLAALCPGHPEQAGWFELCTRLVSADILASCGPNGAWLESPGYQGAGNTPINETVLILRNAGAADLTAHPVIGPRLAASLVYWACLLTPPDPRFDGRRMPMALGDNVPFFSNFQTCLANALRVRFPAAAGQAVWAWQQMGRPVGRAGLLLMQEHVLDDSIPAVPISAETQLFPGFGVIFRHGFGTPAETMMTFRQNDFSYGHYDEDQGSFSLFAKGAPLCLDWIDYSPGDAEHHNRVDYRPPIEPWLVPPPDAVALHPEADYLRCHQAGLPADAPTRRSSGPDSDWQRQLVLVKDTAEPGNATYLVLRDRVAVDRPHTWNLWTLAEPGSERIDGATARLKGQFGVDLLVHFYLPLARPLTATLLRHRTRSYIQMDQDQTRLQASADGPAEYGAIVYPLRRGTDAEPAFRAVDGGVELTWPTGLRHTVTLGNAGGRLVKAANGHEITVEFEGTARP